jgi:excisionase family DNA binding protein
VARRLVPTGEAAETFGVSVPTILRWMKEGRITPADRTLGGHYRWDLDDLRRQLADRKAERETD